VDFAVLQPRHAVVHAPWNLADFRMQGAAEGDVHLLQAAADAEHRHAPGDAGLGELERDAVAPLVIRLMLGIGVGVEVRRVHVGAGTGQEHAVDHVQQRPDIGDFRAACEHKRQGAGDLGDRPHIPLAAHLGGEPVLHLLGVADHADHRFSHR
jgi:hypothetical protein